MLRPAPILLVFLTLAAACGGSGGDAADAAPVVDSQPGPDGDPAADFARAPAQIRVTAVSDNAGGAYATQVAGTLRTADMPSLYAIDPPSGPCRRLRAVIPFCDPACADDALCTAADVCTPYPPLRSAGTLRLAGEGGTRDLPFDDFGGYGLYDANLRFASGTELTASAPGGDFAAFSLAARVPPPLVVTNLEGLQLEPGEPLTLRWVPGDPGARVRVTLQSDTAGHGVWKPSVIECDLPDTGELVVPAALVDAHLEPENWGCGDCASSSIARYRRITTEAGGTTVELVVESVVGLYLTDQHLPR